MKEKLLGLVIGAYLVSTVAFSAVLPSAQNLSSPDFSMDATDLAVMSLNTVYPGVMERVQRSDSEEGSRGDSETGATTDSATATGASDDASDGQGEAVAAKADDSTDSNSTKKSGAKLREFGEEPVVLIVHTHATETYLPSSGGNYHSKKKENSVRDVGEVLAISLKEEGISSVHDETLHDDPSYNSSYSRSAETISKLLEKYPTIECVIDLHRDAIASEAAGATVSTAGKTCAKYMYVVSTAAPTYSKNIKFVSALNETAASEYNGFTGSVLERGYMYNQNLSEKYLLLEFGNNRNDIAEVRNTARVYGKILAQTLKAGA